ncbi:M16 family metallopeptidase [Acetohalobium arabaticum]|uniref:Peptidase M16 domain protein n=1 Tax=Acetohalobium arabaticum (strain ATCC 49924 / DSM 5501 / Z-7288) TaxID=574087 RepID=D9QR74_ACEAZ|nr:pitrilysin family protein [Acetohalobium arabaticum]ADL13015.1 peptidase M16 domain protein [Acetohalobium arabaticum DSM 5501]
MKRIVRLLLISLLIISCFVSTALAESNSNQKLFIPEVDYSHFKLENGLQIYVFEDHQVPLANFSLWYKVGSIDESEEVAGISHLLEHVMFLGTDTLKKDQIHQLIKSVGGTNNAGTYYDYTMYYEEIPSAKLELAMAIEADRMRNLRINPKEFKRERKVVKQERRMRLENNVYSSALEEIQAKAFTKSPLQHQIIGQMESLSNITAEDMQNYYTKYYAPNNAVMVVSGDVNAQEVYRLAKEYYGDYHPQQIERLKMKEPKQTEEKFIKLEKMTELPMVGMMYKIPEGNHPDIVPIEALLNIWINNATSRVKTELKQKQRIIIQAGGFPLAIRRPGHVLVYVMPMSEEMMDRVKEGIDQELHRLIEEGITDEELRIVKKAVLKERIFKQKNISSTARTVAQNVIRYGKPEFYQTEIKRWKNLTKEDIIRVAEKYFTEDNRTVGYVMPQKDKED